MVLSPRCRFCLFIRNYYLAQHFLLKAFPLDLAPPIKKKKTLDEAVFSICGDRKVDHVRACGINCKKIRNAQVCDLADYPVGSRNPCFRANPIYSEVPEEWENVISSTLECLHKTRLFRPLIHVSAHPGVRGGGVRGLIFLGGGVLGLIFAGYVGLGYPIIVYSVVNYGPHHSHF